MNKNNSPYSASFTGCAMLYNEFVRILPLLLSADSSKALKKEIEENNLLMVNSKTSRDRFIYEFKRRFNAVPRNFWSVFPSLSESGQRIALFYSILKAYRLLFDFQYNVSLRHWNSIDTTISKNDILQEFNELSSRDEFVASWSDKTKEKCASQYLTMLRQSGMLNKDNTLKSPEVNPEDWDYYIKNGEEWFLEACFLYPYEIENIKTALL